MNYYQNCYQNSNQTNVMRLECPTFIRLHQLVNMFQDQFSYMRKMDCPHNFKIVGRHINDDGSLGAWIGEKVVIRNSRTDPNSFILGRSAIINSNISNSVIANSNIIGAAIQNWYYFKDVVNMENGACMPFPIQYPVMQPQVQTIVPSYQQYNVLKPSSHY